MVYGSDKGNSLLQTMSFFLGPKTMNVASFIDSSNSK